MGCIGTDVKVLASFLQKRYFIKKEDIEVNSEGYTIYNEAIRDGVQKFQELLKLPVTGIADKNTIERLRSFCK